MRTKTLMIGCILALGLTACNDASEFNPVPIGVAPGGGNAPAQPAQPAPAQPAPAEPNYTGTGGAMLQQSSQPQREIHGAVNSSDCQRMLERFRRDGRRLRLVNVRRNDIGVGGVLAWICEFEEETPGQVDNSYYQDRRYNNPDEYQGEP